VRTLLKKTNVPAIAVLILPIAASALKPVRDRSKKAEKRWNNRAGAPV
jgi:hypothetical protein